MSFEFRNLERLGNSVSVSISPDEHGYLGRECPEKSCEGYFKIKPGTGLTGHDLPCVCPYCGHKGPRDTFWTKAQIEYLRSVALRRISDAIHKDLKQLEFDHKPRGAFGIGVSLKVKSGAPVPIRHYIEKELETHVTCDQCTLEYAVYGVFAYCPDCGAHNSLQILHKNLDLALKQVALANTVTERDLKEHLTGDALENCVSAFDGFAREACRIRAAKSADPSQCANLSFQNLPRAAVRMHKLFSIDLLSCMQPAEWQAAHIGFMRRHLLAHRAGVVDQQYLDETGEPSTHLGRKVVVSATEVGALARAVLQIAGHLIAKLPPPSKG
jgi:hypothetical protein